MLAIFSYTYALEKYHVEKISPKEFERLEKLRAGAPWVAISEPDNFGFIETYHGPAETQCETFKHKK